MLTEKSRGVFIIAVTPFTPNGAIDYASVDTLINFYLEKGVNGITILGMMGEAQKLTCTETREFTRYVIRSVGGRAPVVVGAGNPALANVKDLALIAMDAGAAGILLAPLQGLRTDDQLFDYVSLVCRTLGPDIPIVYQDYPYSTGVYLAASLFIRMVASFPQLVMLKHEDCPGLGKLTRIREAEAGGEIRRVSILVGNGGLYLPLELGRGADGAMTGFAYPEVLVGVCDRFASGNPEAGEDLFDLYLPLIRYEQQPGFGLAVRKELLRRRGAIASSQVRVPGPALSPVDLRELDTLTARLERNLQRAGSRGQEPGPQVID